MINLFKNVRGVQILLSEKQDGNMKLQSFNFKENRKSFLEKNGIEQKNLVSAKLDHGNNVVTINDSSGKLIDYCDGLITKSPNVILSVTSADCLPIFLFDKKSKAVGVLHCGWKSLAKGIIENCAEKMEKELGVNLKDVLIGVGPGIQKCHFEIENDLLLRFVGYEEFAVGDGNKVFLDLTGIAERKFLDLGVQEENIEIDERCTYCDNELWSYRRDGEDGDKDVQAMLALIKLK